VGFDTYLRLLAESVAEMKGEPVPEEKEVRIDLPVKAFIPPDWIGQEALRLELYRRIATAKDHEQLAAVRDEAEDRFGGLPQPVKSLMAVASLKLASLAAGVDEISTFRNQFRIRPVDEARGLELASVVESGSYHGATRTLNLELPVTMSGEDLARSVEDVLRTGEPAEG
jgi:transcription-repair coupling factor (superfamily II helicase)